MSLVGVVFCIDIINSSTLDQSTLILHVITVSPELLTFRAPLVKLYPILYQWRFRWLMIVRMDAWHLRGVKFMWNDLISWLFPLLVGLIKLRPAVAFHHFLWSRRIVAIDHRRIGGQLRTVQLLGLVHLEVLKGWIDKLREIQIMLLLQVAIAWLLFLGDRFLSGLRLLPHLLWLEHELILVPRGCQEMNAHRRVILFLPTYVHVT